MMTAFAAYVLQHFFHGFDSPHYLSSSFIFSLASFPLSRRPDQATILMAREPPHLAGIEKQCTRCGSKNVVWRYFNNGKVSQPRYLCKNRQCGRSFTYRSQIRTGSRPVLPLHPHPLLDERGQTQEKSPRHRPGITRSSARPLSPPLPNDIKDQRQKESPRYFRRITRSSLGPEPPPYLDERGQTQEGNQSSHPIQVNNAKTGGDEAAAEDATARGTSVTLFGNRRRRPMSEDTTILYKNVNLAGSKRHHQRLAPAWSRPDGFWNDPGDKPDHWSTSDLNSIDGESA